MPIAHARVCVAPSDEEAALVMMRTRNYSVVDAHRYRGRSRIDSPSSGGGVATDTEQNITPHTGTDAINVAEGDANLWHYVVPCRSQEATQAIDNRTALASTLGNAEAARVLAQCIATAAKSVDGQTSRALKAPMGELLKLK